MTNYDAQIEELTRRAERIHEKMGLLQRLKELEGEDDGDVEAEPKAKAVKPHKEAAVDGAPVKRGRGRPRKEVPAEGEAAEDAAVDAVDDGAPVKRGRGRPRKVPLEEGAAAPVKRGRGRPRKEVPAEGEKALSLPTLLNTIGQNLNKPIPFNGIVKLVREAGYKSKAGNFSNMVYQSLLKLTKAGMYVKNKEDRTYQYVGGDKKAA